MEKIIINIDQFLQDIVPGYIEKRHNELPVMMDFLIKKDFNNLQILGHRLKGNAGGYGFDQMGYIGAAIEEAAKNKDSIKIELSIKELEHYLSTIEIVYVTL